MPSFNYKAKDKQGKTVTGTLEASDEHRAAASIREQGLWPMDIKPIRGAHRKSEHDSSNEAGMALARYLIYPLWTGVNIGHLLHFYRQMSTMLNAGMSLSEALRSVGARTKGRLAFIIYEAGDHVERGGALSEVLRRYPKIFSRLQISMVRAGEQGGLLEPMFERIASYLEYEISVRRRVMLAALYPVLVLVFALIVANIVLRVNLLRTAGTSEFIASVFGGVFGGILYIVGAVIIAKLVFQFELSRLVWDTIKLNIPIFGSSAKRIAMSRFSRALAVLYSSGLPIGEAVHVAADASANLAVARRVQFVVPALRAGQGITETLEKSKAVSPAVLDMLSTGERTGNMDAVLNKVADYMDDETSTAIQKIAIGLFVVTLLVAAGVVLVIAANFYQNYFNTMFGQGQDAY